MSAASLHILGIDPKMYRHFAVATIAISTIVALFASGTPQGAITQNQQRTELKQADEKKFGKTRLVDKRDDGGRNKSSNSGFRGDFGAPMDGSASTGDNSSYIPAGLALGPVPIIIEVDQAALARMTPEQRKAYLQRLSDERQRRMEAGPTMPSATQLSALAASSAARSGSDEID